MQRRQLILSLSSLAAISAVKAKEAPKGKILIVYYSRKGENWWDGTTRVLQTGNTARMARVIQRTIGGDLYEIETVKPYPADYRETTKVARDELAKEARPAIKKPLPDFSAYRAGKKVVMFATHGGSGLGTSAEDCARAQPRASVTAGLAVRGTAVDRSTDEIVRWARSLRL